MNSFSWLRRPQPTTVGGIAFGGATGAFFGPLWALVGMIVGGILGQIVNRQSASQCRP